MATTRSRSNRSMNIGSNGKMRAIIESISFMWDGIGGRAGLIVESMFPCGCPVLQKVCRPKGMQDVQRYTLVNKEKNGSPALVWVYTFTNADYEAAKARGAVHITLGEI